MSGELIPHRSASLQRQADAVIQRTAARTRVEQAKIQSVTQVAEYGMSAAAYLKRTQRELEHLVPDASDALAVIAEAATLSIASDIRRFGSEQM